MFLLVFADKDLGPFEFDEMIFLADFLVQYFLRLGDASR